jgi:hypothetical protein
MKSDKKEIGLLIAGMKNTYARNENFMIIIGGKLG